MSERAGRLITVEGIDGVGKTTHVNLLMHHLAARGLAVTTYREPGATLLGENIRELAKAGLAHSPLAELLLFCAARAELVETRVKPDLAAGRMVVLDRFTDSALAYQGALGRIGEATLQTVCTAAAGGLTPDLTLWLDLPPADALGRRYPLAQALGQAAGQSEALDAIERRDRGYFLRVRQRYEELANREPWRYVKIASGGAVEDTAEAIRQAVDAKLEEWLNG
jgi:dTMP kinase